MSRMVCDASIVVKLLVLEEDSGRADALMSSAELIAPELLFAEVGNVIWAKVRNATVDPMDAPNLIELLDHFALDIRPIQALTARALLFAIALNHPIYDGFYLALAESLKVPLVTADTRFLLAIRRARFSDVEVLALADLA